MPNAGVISDRQMKRILVVDDDAGVREMLVRVLNDDGFPAIAAADGQEALKLVLSGRFDLVLLDLGMPVKDGWATLASLTHRYPDLAIIVITARSNQRAAAEAGGAAALFEKPLDFPELLQTVGRLLEPASNLQNP
jgi:CheY-like chemotaxis protein